MLDEEVAYVLSIGFSQWPNVTTRERTIAGQQSNPLGSSRQLYYNCGLPPGVSYRLPSKGLHVTRCLRALKVSFAD
jgi:hypothetical protein